MNIENIKKEFPIFDEKIQNNDLVYLDSANSSQKPKVVLDRINDFYSKQFSNVGRSLHYLAVAATNLYENTRSSVQKYINAKDKNEIVFTKGSTEDLNLVAKSIKEFILNLGLMNHIDIEGRSLVLTIDPYNDINFQEKNEKSHFGDKRAKVCQPTTQSHRC